MRFVVLGDLHYSVYSDPMHAAARERVFEAFFKQVVALEADLVFAIGDTTDNGYPEEFEGLHQCARRNGLSFITVNGNHDVLQLTKQEVAYYTGNRFPYFARYFNPTSGASDVTDSEAARFLVLDTPKERNAKDHGGFVGAEQLAWLDNQIAESQNEPLFVFGHHPLTHVTRWSSLPMLSIDNSAQVRRVFKHKRQGAAFYFCGHNHANSIARRGNWHFIQSAAPLNNGDFRVVDFMPEAVTLRTVPIEGGQDSWRLGRKVAQAMGDFHNWPSKGGRRDRELVIKIQRPAAGQPAELNPNFPVPSL